MGAGKVRAGHTVQGKSASVEAPESAGVHSISWPRPWLSPNQNGDKNPHLLVKFMSQLVSGRGITSNPPRQSD